jgi:hypothetical protein
MGEQVTIYVPASLRADFKRAAFEADRKVSHLVGDAMREYLQRRGLPASEEKRATKDGDATKPSPSPGLADVVQALADQAAAIRELRNELRSLQQADRRSGFVMPEGTFSDAERKALQIVCAAGPKGIDGLPFQAAMKEGGYPIGPSRQATTKLQKAGLLKKTTKVWVYADPSDGDGPKDL